MARFGSLTEIFGMRIVPITPPPESNRLRYSASAELALAEPRPRLYPHHSDCPIHQNRTTVVHFHPLHCPIHQNRTHWHAILHAHQRTDPSPHPKSAVRIPQAACYSPGPRRTRHPPADTASPQPSARILPTFPTDHAPTDTATSPENRQYRSQRQSTAPQSHASPAFCRERDVVDAFRRQRQSPLRTTESDFPTKVDHPSELFGDGQRPSCHSAVSSISRNRAVTRQAFAAHVPVRRCATPVSRSIRRIG